MRRVAQLQVLSKLDCSNMRKDSSPGSRGGHGCHDMIEVPVSPNVTLPNRSRGYALLAVPRQTAQARDIEVFVGLASHCEGTKWCEQLYLTDPERPELDPNCGSGCTIFWGMRGIPELNQHCCCTKGQFYENPEKPSHSLARKHWNPADCLSPV